MNSHGRNRFVMFFSQICAKPLWHKGLTSITKKARNQVRAFKSLPTSPDGAKSSHFIQVEWTF
ncbi:hypothetical protein D7Y51_01555 [Stenotrophomonas maltophilia]|nr:hypothetical protein AR275_24440 [Stenotrophomonas maltophilia]MBA0441801.1 hypothetical protein [Stenotrophomonas maltophilia]